MRMKRHDKIRVVVDTNVWISMLLGSDFDQFLDILSCPEIENITTDKLVNEVIEVTHRDKFRKYFSIEEADVLIDWLRTMTFVEIGEIPIRCRDPKDDYLLELAIQANAIYLVSGDADLTSLEHIGGCKIMRVSQFVEEFAYE